MKTKLLKTFSALGVAGVLLISGTASAGYAYHGPHQSYHPYKGHYHDHYGHTYHTPEAPFIW